MSALNWLTDEPPLPKPFGRSLVDAIEWMLINATDLVPHLENADPNLALYVGRRVDQSWRRVEHFATKWLRDDYQATSPELWAGDLERVAGAARRMPAIPSVDAQPDSWAACAREALQIVGDAVRSLAPYPHVVAVQMRIAREAFSLYRLAKYRWIDRAVEAGDLAQVAYQALEA